MRTLKFFLLMLVTALTLSAAPVNSQSLVTKVGLPSEFAPLENCILTGQTVTDVELIITYTRKKVGRKMVTDTAWAYQVVTSPGLTLTGYGLNFIHNYIYSFGLEHAGGMTLHRDGESKTTSIGPFAGQTYYYAYKTLTAESVPGGYDARYTSYPFMTADKKGYPAKIPWQNFNVTYINKMSSPGSTVKSKIDVTADKLLAKTGITEAWLATNTYRVYHFRTVDPSIYVTSIFGLIDKTGDVYTNSTLINGQHYKSISYQSLKTPWGNPLGELNFSWVVYNDCAIPAVKPTDANSTGNFGECFRKMYNSTDPKSLSVTIIPGTAYAVNNSTGTITYDSNKPAAVQLVVHRNPMPEKNTEQEGYWSLTNNTRVYSLQGL